MADSGDIYTWQDDPGEPPTEREPVRRPAPDLTSSSLPIAIEESQPSAGSQDPATEDFRWWTAADALARSRDLWESLLPSGTRWFATVGTELRVRLDAPEDQLNAYYDRRGLEFFHDTARGVTCFSGESPDIVSHELGHAVLDALRPQLWDATGTEPAAFHEAFGDISALLTALQLPSLRDEVVTDTGGKLWRSSRVSRLAEQLGWAIRQGAPDRAEATCLRDAANSWFYRDPATLPPDGPATQLSSEFHFFSRIFTGAFLKVLAAMFDEEPERDEASLLRVSLDLGRLLVDAVVTAPIVPGYYSQVAAHMLAADSHHFDGKHAQALRFGFTRHGVLALTSAQDIGEGERGVGRGMGVSFDGGDRPGAADLPEIALPGTNYGLPGRVLVQGCGQTPRFGVAGAAPDVGAVITPSSDRAAELFVEDLLRLGRVDVEAAADATTLRAPLAYKTHELHEAHNGYALRRRVFDCGLHPPGCRG